jgi:hypothetical protein
MRGQNVSYFDRALPCARPCGRANVQGSTNTASAGMHMSSESASKIAPGNFVTRPSLWPSLQAACGRPISLPADLFWPWKATCRERQGCRKRPHGSFVVNMMNRDVRMSRTGRDACLRATAESKYKTKTKCPTLTRHVLWLTLRAHYVRPISLPAKLSHASFVVNIRTLPTIKENPLAAKRQPGGFMLKAWQCPTFT